MSATVVTLQPPHMILRTEAGDRYLPLVGNNCWTIGRGRDNTFVLTDRWISRNHAMIQQMDKGDFYLIDLGSRNGSFVNSRRVSIPVILKDSDRLVFGQTELEFNCPLLGLDKQSGIDGDSQDFTATLHVRRLISVMVMDIRDFTVLTRKLDERVLSEVIGSWFRQAGDIIRKNGSWVDKYIGDAIMAVWFHGAEGVSSAEMIRIFQALKDLYEVTRELSKIYPLPFPLRVGAGINTGYAMVSNAGSSERSDYTALGDTVNAAFRLESSTKEIGMDIALGEGTYQYICDLENVHQIFKQYQVNLKGYDSSTITYGGTFNNLNTFLGKKLFSAKNQNLF
ncbi:MAG: adenylate/guanylate cyclase domain-containing protein [Okeania sp. SIO2C2]|uniref:adenylate/guanylate cyclase domain-containing protein n=1 Tax=Okeania sp. SIO2C2 TaxID=2607787 RepID=UPI0013B9380B|nr:adenylate/guanylate cyclase domain-containing protein [Okeania sp. SIO2C2]NEP89366.1 adenylate/guanylate cyclase domain-containing protein [Okeania sp. SIO2C2]